MRLDSCSRRAALLTKSAHPAIKTAPRSSSRLQRSRRKQSETKRSQAREAGITRTTSVKQLGPAPCLPGAVCTQGASPAVVTLTYGNCVFPGSGAIWNGSETLAFTNGDCPNTANSSFVPPLNGNSFLKTFSPGTTRATADQSITVTLDTSKASVSGWDSAVQNDSLKTTAVARITQDLTYSQNSGAPCGQPTGGEIDSTLSGQSTPNETLTFSGSCGAAIFKSNRGLPQRVLLRHSF